MVQLIWVLWPSFVVAGIGETAFFAAISPDELHLFGRPVDISPIATYSAGFMVFWALCASSSLFTCFLQRSTTDVNAALKRAPSGIRRTGP